MKYQLLLCLMGLSLCLSAQQLNFSSTSSQGGVHTTDDGQQFIYNIGEPIISFERDRDLLIMQGLLNTDYEQSTDERAVIQIRVFLDENEDGLKDLEEEYIVMGKVQVVGQELYQITSEDGINYFASPGTYSFDYFNLADGFRYTTSQRMDVTIEAGDRYKKVDFGVAAEEIVEGAEIYLSSGAFRCFREIDYMLCFRNTGTELLESTVFLEIDERLDSIFFPEQPDVIINDHLVGWDFSLNPGQNRIIRYSLNAPEVDSPDDIGVIYKTRAWIDLANNDRKELCYEQELRCSYDPNDKLVYPNREDSLALLTDELVYTIRFQNTGNDVADDVVVVDTLSRNLDLETFFLINTSHPDKLEVLYDTDDPYIVNFQFKNIFLPDSTTNEPASNGHVTFAIKPVEGLPEDTEINNTGYIYFDFNPAIITNTTSSTLVDEFPIVATDDPQKLWTDFYVYPNPTEGQINFSERVDEIQLWDVNGRQLLQAYDVKTISISDFNDGTYFIKAYKDDKLATDRIILFNNN